MANRVQSKNVIVELLIGAAYYPIFCGKTMEYTQSQELIEVTSINSGYSREYESGMTTADLNISGVTILDNTGNRIAVTYLMRESVRRVPQTMRIRLIDDDAGTIQIAFSALVVTNTLSRSYGTYSQSTTQLKVTGDAVISSVIAPPGLTCPEDPLYIDVVAGASSVHSALLETAGITILEVCRSGMQFNQTSGTPGNAQFRYGGTDGYIYFDTTNPFNAGEVIYILYML